MTHIRNWITEVPKPIHDPEALFAARYALREAWTAIRRLRQADPTVRITLDRLDAMCAELTLELETCEPSLPLQTVAVGCVRRMVP